jgi:prepilin-type N-terminal cleavage/methylation domain-containing protein
MDKILKTAFTLIELLVVIAIIGILSGLIVVTMSGVTSKANIAKGQVFSNSLRNALMLNLISEWKLDGNANDSWGSNNGTLNGSPASFNNCIYGSCYSFDGADDYIYGGNSSLFNFGSSSFTVSAWFKTSSTSASGGSYRTIISFGPWDNNLGWKVSIRNTDGKIQSWWNDVAQTTGATVVNNDNWHNMAYTRSGNTFSLYLDGAQDGTSTFANPLGYTGVYVGVGGHVSVTDGGYWSGPIDEIRIYNATIPASLIKERYYADLNNLLVNRKITRDEYLSRIGRMGVIDASI